MIDEAFPAGGTLQEVVDAGLDGVLGMDVGWRVTSGEPALEHFVVGFVGLRGQVLAVERLRVGGGRWVVHFEMLRQDAGKAVAGHVLVLVAFEKAALCRLGLSVEHPLRGGRVPEGCHGSGHKKDEAKGLPQGSKFFKLFFFHCSRLTSNVIDLPFTFQRANGI